MYQQMIIEALGCSEEDAVEIEELMRLETGGTLDHLRRREFNALARLGRDALAVFREEEEKGAPRG